MRWPEYDPAVAANVISVLAFIIAGASYRLTRKAEIGKKEALLPDVSATATAVTGRDGWYSIRLAIKNNFATELYVTDVNLRKSAGVVGVNETDATENDNHGSRRLKAVFPIEICKRVIDIGRRVAAAGTERHPFGLNPGDKVWLTFYALGGSRESLEFDVNFSLRETDIRRSDRHVSHQKVRLPAKQTS